MGGTTAVHAGFLLKGEEIWQVLPKKPGEPEVALFGTYKIRPFTTDHWKRLIGQRHKTKITLYINGVTKKLVSTLSIGGPVDGCDAPFSVSFSNSLGTSAYPVPPGQAAWQNSSQIFCCNRSYTSSTNYCGVCGTKLAAPGAGIRYVNSTYQLMSVFGQVRGPVDPVDAFELKDILGISEEEHPSEWVQDEFYEIGEAIAEKLGGVCSTVGHMKDWTFLVAPQVEGYPWSKDLWSDKQNYIKLADVDAHRDAIEAMRKGLVDMGFKNPQFVFHPEWVE